jgi:hypothetical protein
MGLKAMAGRVQRALSVPPVLPVSYLLGADGSVTRVIDPPVFRTIDQVRAAVERREPHGWAARRRAVASIVAV